MLDNWEWEDAYFEHLGSDAKQRKLDSFVKLTKRNQEGGVGAAPSNPPSIPSSEPSTVLSGAASSSTTRPPATPLKLTESQLHLIEFNKAAAKMRLKERLAAKQRAADEAMFWDLDLT